PGSRRNSHRARPRTPLGIASMRLPEPLFVVINPVIRALLRSPVHGLMSKSLMLITFTGRKSGRRYTTPVRYVVSMVQSDALHRPKPNGGRILGMARWCHCELREGNSPIKRAQLSTTHQEFAKRCNTT